MGLLGRLVAHVHVMMCCQHTQRQPAWKLPLSLACSRLQTNADSYMCTFRFDIDQTFSSLQGSDLETMSVVDGTWYVYLKGDYAGRVSGTVYDLRNSSDPVKLVTTVSSGIVQRMSVSHSTSSFCAFDTLTHTSVQSMGHIQLRYTALSAVVQVLSYTRSK